MEQIKMTLNQLHLISLKCYFLGDHGLILSVMRYFKQEMGQMVHSEILNFSSVRKIQCS